MLAGALLLAVVWVFLLRYVPDALLVTTDRSGREPGLFVPTGPTSCAPVRADHAGVGLGQAIVTSITGMHGESLTVVPRPGGGLCVAVHLSATPSADTWSTPRGLLARSGRTADAAGTGRT